MHDQDPFTPDRTLLNPKFESYKLQPSAPSATSLYALPSPGLHLRPLPDHARLSYAEVQERVRHNHLSVGVAGEVVFVNGELQVVAIELDEHAVPTFHALVELPQPVSTSSGAVFEYPTALAVDQDQWAVSDGAGQLYLIRVCKAAPKWTSTIERTLELVGSEGELLPFRLHSVDLAPGGKLLGLLSASAKVAQAPLPKFPGVGGARAKLPSTTEFDYLCVDLASSPMRVRWRVRSHDLPAFVRFLPDSSTYLIGAPSAPAPDDAAATLPIAATSAPTPATDSTSSAPPSPTPAGPKPPPFSWVQDTDSLTVAFAVPSDTPTSSIRVTFSRQFLSLLVGSAAAFLAPNAAVPRVSHQQFWDAIDPHSSVWTFDREAEGRDSTFGVLSLHLEKANPGTRWPDLFATTHGVETTPGARQLEGVPETVDPSELAAISESMEQWTQGVPGGVGASNEGIGQGVPTSLTGDEMDVEVDGDAGRPCVVSWLKDVEGHPPTIVRPHPAFGSSLLCTPLPISPRNGDTSIVVKNDVDGLAFAPPPSAAEGWMHTTTFPALAFVLATKRDASFVYHLDHTAVFAFDSPSSPSLAQAGQGVGSAGNLFVYLKPQGTRDVRGTQLVLRIGGPTSGSLLGVGAVTLAGQAPVVLALCENELVVYRIL